MFVFQAPDLSDSQESHSKLNEPQVNGSDHKKETPNSPPKSAPANISPEQTKFEKVKFYLKLSEF